MRCVVLLFCVFLAACSAVRGAQYWQRIHASDAAYTQGPKAQDMLSRDIARCVTEVEELERLGMVNDPIPMDAQGRVLDPDHPAAKKRLEDVSAPEREGFLLVEMGDYYDFEGCMTAKGWERVKYLPYDQAKTARNLYYEAVDADAARSSHGAF